MLNKRCCHFPLAMLNKRCCHDAMLVKSHTMWFHVSKNPQNKTSHALYIKMLSHITFPGIHNVVVKYCWPHHNLRTNTHTPTHTVLLTTACHVAHKAAVVNCLLHFQAPEVPQNRTGVQQLVNDFEHIRSYLPVTIAA